VVPFSVQKFKISIIFKAVHGFKLSFQRRVEPSRRSFSENEASPGVTRFGNAQQPHNKEVAGSLGIGDIT
jgi:hypothetical protein